MGFTDRSVTPLRVTKNTDAGFRPYSLRIQLLKILAREFVFEPPTCNLQLLLEQVRLVPQLCSISSRTCNNPHHDVRADLDRPRIIGVGLPAFLLSRLAATPKKLARDLSGGTYPFALRERAFQLFFRLFELQPRSSNLQKIKNPASSAGHSHRSSGFARSSTNCYPVLVRRLTIGLFLVYFRPTVNSPDRSDEYCTPRTINEYTGFHRFVKLP